MKTKDIMGMFLLSSSTTIFMGNTNDSFAVVFSIVMMLVGLAILIFGEIK